MCEIIFSLSMRSFHMKNNNIFLRIRDGALSIYDTVSDRNELYFQILFAFYVAFNFFLKIQWNDGIDVDFLRVAFTEIIMLGAAIYLVYAFGAWKNLIDNYLWALFLVGVALMAGAGYLSTKLSTNSFGVIFDMYFCLMIIGGRVVGNFFGGVVYGVNFFVEAFDCFCNVGNFCQHRFFVNFILFNFGGINFDVFGDIFPSNLRF